jgi:hypothetical protein
MQAELQHADPYADPHDAIGAQLRDIAPRIAHDMAPRLDPSEFGVTTPASPEPVNEPSLQDKPLNDNISGMRDLKPRAGAGRGVALVVCASLAAAAAWHSYGDEARQRLSTLMPQFLAGAPAPSANSADPQNPASQTAADPASAQEAVAPVTAMETPPAQTALPSDLAQSIETMTREIALLKQTVQQLQAGQQQLGRDVAKVTEHEAHPKPVARVGNASVAPRPQRASATGAPPRNLGSLTPYSASPANSQRQAYPQGAAQREAYIASPAPTQLPPQPGDTSAPRPPMPLR